MNRNLIWVVVAAGGAWYILRKRGAAATATSKVATITFSQPGDGRVIQNDFLTAEDLAKLSAGSVDGPSPASVAYRRLGAAGLFS